MAEAVSPCGMDDGGGEADPDAWPEAGMPTASALASLPLALASGDAVGDDANITCFNSFMVSPTCVSNAFMASAAAVREGMYPLAVRSLPAFDVPWVAVVPSATSFPIAAVQAGHSVDAILQPTFWKALPAVLQVPALFELVAEPGERHFAC